jgi:hypothetical protein
MGKASHLGNVVATEFARVLIIFFHAHYWKIFPWTQELRDELQHAEHEQRVT